MFEAIFYQQLGKFAVGRIKLSTFTAKRETEKNQNKKPASTLGSLKLFVHCLKYWMKEKTVTKLRM